MKSNIEMKMDLMERRQAVHANKIQALMLMITVMQIPEKEKNRKMESVCKTGRGKLATIFFFDLQETSKSNANRITG